MKLDIYSNEKKEAGIKEAEEAWKKEEATKEEAPREEEEAAKHLMKEGITKAKIILVGRFTANGQPWFEYANNKKEFLFALDKIYSNVQANGFVHKVIIKGNSVPEYVLNECDPTFIVDSIELVK